MSNRTFNREDAQRIFAAAAERQQNDREAAKDQLSVEDLIEAGEAAGIDASYIQAAAADMLRPEHGDVRRRFWGMPVEMRQATVVPGQLDDDTWARIVMQLRRRFKKHGDESTLGALREWVSDHNSNALPIKVVAEPEGGDTRITFERTTWPRALGFSIATGVNLLTGLIFLGVWLGSGMASEFWIPALILLSFSTLFGSISYGALRAWGNKEIESFKEALKEVRHLAEAGQGSLQAPASPQRQTQEKPESGHSLESGKRFDLDELDSPPEAETDAAARRQRNRN